ERPATGRFRCSDGGRDGVHGGGPSRRRSPRPGVFIPPRSASLAGLTSSIAPRRRHGITASVRLPWTLPAVPALPLAGSAACWLVTGVGRSVARVSAWVDNRGVTTSAAVPEVAAGG